MSNHIEIQLAHILSYKYVVTLRNHPGITWNSLPVKTGFTYRTQVKSPAYNQVESLKSRVYLPLFFSTHRNIFVLRLTWNEHVYIE